jgi:hypothetical protein
VRTEWPEPSSVPVRRAGVSPVPLDDNVAVYDDVGQLLILLNPSAAAVLAACDGTATFDQVVGGLAAEHAGDAAEIRRDAWETVRKLAELGLVHGEPTAAG